MNRSPPIAHTVFSAKQGQYLAFIYAYTVVLGPPRPKPISSVTSA